MKKPTVKLIGQDGNVFNIVGLVYRALQKVGQKKEAEEFKFRAFNSKSYNEVLTLLEDYVKVK